MDVFRLASRGLLLATLLTASGWSLSAWAQVGLGQPGMGPPGMGPPGMGPPGMGPPGSAAPPPASAKQPQTHAASGGDNPSQLPTEAAQLPEDPNAIPEQVEDLLGSDFDPELERRPPEKLQRRWYGPWFQETGEDYALRTLFPLWFERRQGNDRSSLFGLNYFRRRSENVDADVVFPFFWKMRHGRTHTTVVGPVMHQESPKGHANWVAPLFFEGKGAGGKQYLHIPPLLSFHHRTADRGFSMAGPLFCKWQGGSRCDGRSATEIDYGLAPFYFYGRDQKSEYELIPPLLRYYRYTEAGERELDIWGPVWREKSREGGAFNLLPFFWHNWTADSSNTTVFPFMHYGRKGAARTLATPLFVDHRDEEGAHTFATWLYARHRGRTELDMYTPLFWQYRDPDIDLERTVAAPFYYRNTSPRSDDLALFPFFGQFKRHGISTTRWFTPLVRHETNLTGWQLNVMPLFHAGREYDKSHLVLAPLWWDFASPNSRQTVAFPLFWRFRDHNSVSQLIGNTFYYEEQVEGGSDWQFHFFPVFSYGETPRGHWWNVLYGLAGFTREGTMAKMRLGYIPFTLSD